MIHPSNLYLFAIETSFAGGLFQKVSNGSMTLYNDLSQRQQDGHTNQQIMAEFNYRTTKLPILSNLLKQITICELIFNAEVPLYKLVEGDSLPPGGAIGDFVDNATKTIIIIDISQIT